MKKFFTKLVVGALFLAVVALAAGASQYGGQVARSDLFRKFFTWDGSSNVTAVNAVKSAASSGNDAFAVTINGARFHFGIGAGDYASSDGTTVTFNGPLAGGGSGNPITIGNAANRITWSSGRFIISDETTGNLGLSSFGLELQTAGSAIALGSGAGANPLVVFTAPTISSGFGSSSSIVASNGTAAFEINVGTGGTASAGVVGLPTATTGWVCQCTNLNPTATAETLMTANATTSCTLTNVVVSSGSAIAWSASAKLWCTAFAL